MGRDLTFINVNGVKVAFTEAQNTGGKQQKVLDSFLGFGKVEIIRG
jgi:hypothetical protein